MAFIGYGGVGAARAIEQLRLVDVELQRVSMRNSAHVGVVEFLGIWQQGKSFDDFPHPAQSAAPMFDELAWRAKALRSARMAAN